MENISDSMPQAYQPESCLNITGSSESFQISSIGYILLEVIIMVFILFGNSMVLLAVRRFEELRTSINTFVVSLAVSDLTVALLALPVHIAIYMFPQIKFVFGVCILRYCSLVLGCGTSIVTLMLISINRFIAIEMPFKYPRLMSHRRCKGLCAVIWLYGILSASVPFFGWNHWGNCIECTFTVVLPSAYILFILGHIIIIVLIIGFLNWKIFLTANRVSKEIEQQVSAVTDQSNQTKKMFAMNRKAAATLALVFGVYSLCNLPFAFFVIWEIYILNKEPTLKENIPNWFHVIRIATTFLTLINSGMNPIIYHRKIPEFRKAFRKILRLKKTILSEEL